MKNRVRAFTLIELLVVVSVITILSTLIFVNLGSTRAKAKDEQRISSAQLIGSALDQYAMSHSRQYPTFGTPSSNNFYVKNINPMLGSACTFCNSQSILAYINPIPEDSLNTTNVTNMKYVYNGDGTKAAVIIDKMETGTKLCNIDTANTATLPDPVKVYMGIAGAGFTLTGGGNSSPCYYVSK